VSSDNRSGRESAASPDNFPRAWLVVVAAFLASFVVFGVLYSFGVFLRPMAAEFGTSAAATSAFFSITAAIFYSAGALTGGVADRFEPRVIVATGAVILGGGLCVTSLANQIWLCYVAYGIGVGIGGACCYLPTLAIVGGWFSRHRNTALSIAAAGTGSGTMVVPPVAATLIQCFGWRATNAIFGIVAGLVLLACALMVAAPPILRAAPDASGALKAIVRSRPFITLYLSWLLATTALFVPFVFLPTFARDHGANEVAAAALISIIGGTSIIGRLLLGPVGDRFGVVPLFKLTVLMMAISYAIWLFSSSYLSLVIFAVVLGLGYGSRIAAVPAVMIECFGLRSAGAVLGMFFTGSGLSALFGPWLAGLAVDLTADYRGGIVFALAIGLLGFIVIAPLRIPQPASGVAA
jgi:MFS family permease